MLTPEGAVAVWEALGAEFVLRVSDGTTTDSVIATTVEIRTLEEDGQVSVGLYVEGEFESSEANFEWRRRDVAIVRAGQADVTLDREDVDLGRKAEGSIWTVAATIELEVGA